MSGQKKIFVVDDDPGILTLIQRWLGRSSLKGQVSVTTFEDPMRLLAAFSEGEQPDLVVTDRSMVGPMNGEQLAERLRTKGYCNPIIMYTAEAAGIGENRNIDAIVLKTPYPTELLAAIERLLGKQAS